MIFKLASKTSMDSLDIDKDIVAISSDIEIFFKERNYSDVKEVHMGVLCVSEKFEQFFSVPKTIFYKEKRMIETGIKIDFSSSKLPNQKRRKIIKDSVYKMAQNLVCYFSLDYEKDLKKWYNSTPLE